MNPSFDDQELRDLVQRVRIADEHRIPAFHDVLQRSTDTPNQLPAWRGRRILVTCGIVATLTIAILVLSFRGDIARSHNEPNVAKDTRPDQNLPERSYAQDVDIDFEQLQAMIDEAFVTKTIPEWPTRTDTLLAINLEIPSHQE